MRRMQRWRHPAQSTPESVLQTLARATHSLIVHVGANDALQPFYWQLRQGGREREVAVRTLALPRRAGQLPLVVDQVAAFWQAQTARGLTPVYLLKVARRDLAPGVLAYVNAGAPADTEDALYLVLPAQVMYDFVANATGQGQSLVPSVGELLDGWPMRATQTIAAYALAPRQRGTTATVVPVPTGVQTYPQWAQAEQKVGQWFDAPLRRVVASETAATFVFTDID